MEPSASPSPLVRPAWVLLAEEARHRGFRNALAFRRWCRRRGIALRADGRKQWVAPGDIDRVIEALPARATTPAPGEVNVAVADAVATLISSPRPRSRRAHARASATP